jgi:hypothetical protein
MSSPPTLRSLAIARSGDKGNPVLERLLTAECVKAHFKGVVQGDVVRYTLADLGAVHFVMHDALGGGVTRSLALDAHGKTLSAAILSLPLPSAFVSHS